MALFLVGGTVAFAQSKQLDEIGNLPDHPRILMLKSDEQIIKDSLLTDSRWMAIHQAILDESNNIISLPVLERIKTGRRLLDVSREALRRIFHLSYAYRMTNSDKYKDRAEKELLAVSTFSDWNPSHFLDVAEMTLAVSIGYDWLYNSLSASSRETIKNAILKKGLDVSLDDQYNDWLRSSHNWNQVCNTGITYGALAVYEDMPALSKQIINRSIESIALPMKEYGPDGAYPEGFTYWSYGTNFNVLFLSVMEKLFKNDFSLSAIKGFLPSAQYVNNMIAPSMDCFNYGDCGDRTGLNPVMFWFSNKTKDSSVLWNQRIFMKQANLKSLTQNRLFPAIMIWAIGTHLDQVMAPQKNTWTGQGVMPVSLMRTSWIDKNAIFVGFKGGRAGANHSHMDVSSFVMESDGVRWAIDLGPQDYNSLESVGIDLWNRKQNSQRWDVFRYNNLAHNVLTIDNQKQHVAGYASISNSGENPDFMYAVSDITDIYKNQLNSAKRGIAIVKKNFVVIRDELKANDKKTTVKWSMVTSANVKITGKNTIELQKDGKKLTLKVESPVKFNMKTWSTQSLNKHDAPNTGTIIVGFEAELPAGSNNSFCVKLIPDKAKYTSTEIPELTSWNKFK